MKLLRPYGHRPEGMTFYTPASFGTILCDRNIAVRVTDEDVPQQPEPPKKKARRSAPKETQGEA